MELYLIRHGQSENNARPEHLRVEDALLTELGHQQADLLAQWVKTVELDRLFSSPFRRALQTAWPIQQASGVPVEVLVPLHEVGGCMSGPGPDNFVGCPGIRRSELLEEFPGYQVPEEIDQTGWWKSKPAEDDQQVHQRATDVLDWVRQEFAAGQDKVGFVMHADVTRHLLNNVARVTSEHSHRILYNTSVTRLSIEGEQLALELYNSISHLPMSLTSR